MIIKEIYMENEIKGESTKNSNQNIKKTKKPRSIIAPIILIVVGLVFLINNLGFDLPWEYVWPVLIILIGILMIFGRGMITGGVVFLLVLLIIFSLFISLIDSNFFNELGIHIDTLKSEQIDEQSKNIDVKNDEYSDVKEIDLNVDIGVGEYTLTSISDEINYFTSVGQYNYETFEPELEQTFENGKLTLNYSTKDIISLFGVLNPISDYSMNLGNPEILTNFDLSIGTGKSNIDLNDQQIGKFDVSVGTGVMNIDVDGINKKNSSGSIDVGTGKLVFSGILNSNITKLNAEVGTGKLDLLYNGITDSNNFDLDVDVGTGTVVIGIPEEYGFKIVPSVGTGKISVNNNNIDDEENYTSNNYNDAEVTIEMDFDIGTGSVSINSN